VTSTATSSTVTDGAHTGNGQVVIIYTEPTAVAQTVTFTSTPPNPATVGAFYQAAATATSGSTVTYALDGLTTNGACTVSSDGVVKFDQTGTCAIDAIAAAGNGYAAGHATQSFPVTPPDDDLALSTPFNVTVNATSPTGATVTYPLPTVTDEDTPLPAPTCNPASGTTFPVGQTTVHCTVNDPDDTNSPVTSAFTVTVNGAGTQLAALHQSVIGVGPGTSLADEISQAQSYLAAGNTAGACNTLTGFTNEVRAQSGKSINTATAQQLTTTAQRIQKVIGC
jgi:hypothetical protein